MGSSALCEGRQEDIGTVVKLMQVFMHYFGIERNKFAVVEAHLPTDLRTTHCRTVMCWTGWLWLHVQQTDGEIKGRQLHIHVTLRVLPVTCVCYFACATSPCYSACDPSSCDTTCVISLCYTVSTVTLHVLPVCVTLHMLPDCVTLHVLSVHVTLRVLPVTSLCYLACVTSPCYSA